jgi:hypothetical protein
MPGVIPHLIVGSAMFIIGRYYFRDYFDGGEKVKERILLAVVCVSFSFIPDVLLLVHYTTHLFSFEAVLPYHGLAHIMWWPIAIAALLIIKYGVKTKREPIWLMGFWSIVLHLTIDLFMQESGIWI